MMKKGNLARDKTMNMFPVSVNRPQQVAPTYQQRQKTPMTMPSVRIALVSVISCRVRLRRLRSACRLVSMLELSLPAASETVSMLLDPLR